MGFNPNGSSKKEKASLDIVPRNALQESPCNQMCSITGAKVMVISYMAKWKHARYAATSSAWKEKEETVALNQVEIFSNMK